MNIIEEHRTEVRVGTAAFTIGLVAQPGDSTNARDRLVTVTISGTGAEGEQIAEGRIGVSAEAVPTLGSVLADTLRAFSGIGRPQRRRPGDRPAAQGQPWTDEQDAELEACWRAGETVEDIARRFERTPGGIRARLPRVGCDPEKQGAYLPVPPSRRTEESPGGVSD